MVLANQLARFVQQVQRKSQAGVEPNDRSASREIAQKLKQLPPEEVSELLAPEEGLVPAPRTKRKQFDPRFKGEKRRK